MAICPENKDQKIVPGDPLLYHIGEFESIWGDPMEVKVDLGIASEFLEWDETTNSFKIASQAEPICGEYEICA